MASTINTRQSGHPQNASAAAMAGSVKSTESLAETEARNMEPKTCDVAKKKRNGGANEGGAGKMD
jgi:hypothetical protein